MRPLLTVIWINIFFAIVASSFLLEPWLMMDIPVDGEGNLMILIIAQMYYIFFFWLINLVVGIISIYRARESVPFGFGYILPDRKVDGPATLLFKSAVLLLALYDGGMAVYFLVKDVFEREAVPLVISVLLLFFALSRMLGISAASAKAYRKSQLLSGVKD